MSGQGQLNLPEMLKAMIQSQHKWLGVTQNTTLAKHKRRIENMLVKMNLLDLWSNRLGSTDVARKLIPEIYTDGIVSIHLATFGLYKYANSCLRSQLENTLRLVYFFTHQVEFGWWSKGDEWYVSGIRNKDVWGEGYKYFEELESIKKFEKLCGNRPGLFKGDRNVRALHKSLSKHVHSAAYFLQTRSHRISPSYRMDEFSIWASNADRAFEHINELLAVGLLEEFKAMNDPDRERILRVAVGKPHRDILKSLLKSNA